MTYIDCKNIKINTKEKCKTNRAVFRFVCLSFSLFVILGSIFCYLGFVNYQSTAGYRMNSLEKELAMSEEKVVKMNMRKIELMQMDRIEELAMNSSMVEVKEARYVEVGSPGAVALLGR